MNTRQRQVCFEIMRRVLQRGQNVRQYLDQAIKRLTPEEQEKLAWMILETFPEDSAESGDDAGEKGKRKKAAAAAS